MLFLAAIYLKTSYFECYWALHGVYIFNWALLKSN